MPAVFLTGFPGFLGSVLVERLLDRYPEDMGVVCLVQPKFRGMAEGRAVAIEGGREGRAGRIRLVDGDITAEDLGLGNNGKELQKDTIEVFHLAAVYDLGVKRDLAMRVNVSGTANVLRFADGCPGLKRFQYVSTCYVSGRYDGVFEEEDLTKDQRFNNHYEETKHLAELLVRQHMRDGLPSTIYRPAITVGDSRTGETQKYDGPYFIMQWILRQPRAAALLPVIGDPERYTVNVAPRNFIMDAISHLSSIEDSEGKTYQLCDPKPPTVGEILDIIAEATGRRIVRIPLPKFVAKGALKYVPGMYRVMRIEPGAVDYFVHPTRYSCENTLRDLAGTGIACPPFASYCKELVAFMKSHPEIGSAAMA